MRKAVPFTFSSGFLESPSPTPQNRRGLRQAGTRGRRRGSEGPCGSVGFLLDTPAATQARVPPSATSFPHFLFLSIRYYLQ